MKGMRRRPGARRTGLVGCESHALYGVGCDRAGRVAGAILLACVLWAGLLAAPSFAQTISARVVGVIDGDTVDVLTPEHRQIRIRLAQIDAPEHDQPWGYKSKQALSALVFNKDVTVNARSQDRYGRTVAMLSVGPLDVNQQMVREGAAWAYSQYVTDPSMFALEDQARARHEGLWSLPSSQTMPPWEWRHGGKGLASTNQMRTMAAPATSNAGHFQCGAKLYCREMSSCAEATYYLKVCGLRRLDGDGDGVPCERLCGHH